MMGGDVTAACHSSAVGSLISDESPSFLMLGPLYSPNIFRRTASVFRFCAGMRTLCLLEWASIVYECPCLLPIWRELPSLSFTVATTSPRRANYQHTHIYVTMYIQKKFIYVPCRHSDSPRCRNAMACACTLPTRSH